jgi:DNA recombination protein RmuC
MEVSLILAVIVALAVGALIGWLVAGRNSAGAAQTVENLRMQLNGVTAERDEARANLDSTSRELAALQADARNFDRRMKDLAESKDALIAQFRGCGSSG